MTIRSAILLAFGLASLHGAGAAPPFVGGLARHEKASPKISGAVLINELSCVACHASSRAEFAAKAGPDLSTVGSRVMGEHLRRFIEAPSTTKSGTTMPDVLGHLPAAERASRAEALPERRRSRTISPRSADNPRYVAIILGADQIKLLKKGKNVLAAYSNDLYNLTSSENYAAIDLRIEGITKADQEKLDLALEEIFSHKDKEILKGASNGGYHYFGSAKIFAQMGKAFAEAILNLQK